MNSSGSEKFGFEQVMKDCVDANGKLNWESVFRAIEDKQLSPVPHRPEEVGEIRDVLLDTLLTSGCDDERFVLRFFQFYERYLEKMFRNYSYRRMAGFINGTFWRRRRNISREDISFFLLPPPIVRYPYGVPPPGTPAECVSNTLGQQEAEWRAMNLGDFKFMEAQVKYGHWKGRLDIEKYNADYMQREDFLEFIAWIHSNPPVLQFLQYDFQELWSDVSDRNNSMVYCKKFRRTPLIVRTLKAAFLLHENSPIAEQYVQCLRVYFATIPYPMVAHREVLDFLDYVTRQLWNVKDGHDVKTSEEGENQRSLLISNIMRDWTMLFGREIFRPRSLAHLCRLSARSALLRHKLDKSFVLPDLVGRLSLPRTLEDFLLGAPEKDQWAKTVLKRSEEPR